VRDKLQRARERKRESKGSAPLRTKIHLPAAGEPARGSGLSSETQFADLYVFLPLVEEMLDVNDVRVLRGLGLKERGLGLKERGLGLKEGKREG
jgi:hypothetical protein